MLAVLALVTPAALGIFVDRVLGGSEPWGSVVAGVMAAAAVLVYGLTWLKQRWLQRLSARISVIAGNRCLSRLLRLPVEYFSHRLVGELTVRLLFIDRIARNLSEHLLGVLIEIAMSALTVGRAMFITSIVLAAGFLILVLSPFIPTAQVGLLTSLIIAFALAADVLLLPPLLLAVERRGASAETAAG